MGSKSAYPAGWNARPVLVSTSSLTSDGTNQLMHAQPPVPSGLGLAASTGQGTGASLLQAALKRSYSTIHLEIKEEAAQHPGEKVDPFTVAETFRHYVVEGHWIDKFDKRHRTKNTEYIHKYKAYYVHAMRDTIKAAAARFNLPAVLLAGTVYNEVGGADLVKPYVHAFWELVSFSDRADRISLGPTSLQPRRALDALGYDPATVDSSLKKEVLESLINNHAFAIFVCAKHLSDLRDVFFADKGAGNLVDDQIAVLGERYNQGPDQSDETFAKDLSYGKRIIGRKEKLTKLLTDTPVSEPDWSEPLKNALRRIGEDLNRAARDGFPFPGP